MHCTKDDVNQVDGTALEGHVCDNIVRHPLDLDL
jgi:hypothetical protein